VTEEGACACRKDESRWGILAWEHPPRKVKYMKRLLRSANGFLTAIGIDLRKAIISLRDLPAYLRDLRAWRRRENETEAGFARGRLRPCLGERSADSGHASGHYFHQDLHVARRICVNRPAVHVDVGSRVDGFVAHVASFRDITVFDIRPLPGSIANIRSVQVDVMQPVAEEFTDYCDSLSCLHALEHFGLGRYGDPVDHQGHLRGLDNLHRILKAGGKLYLSLPMGPQRVEFNAHRVFSLGYLRELLEGRYRIDQFSYIDDLGEFHADVTLTDSETARNFGCEYGCAVFELTKL